MGKKERVTNVRVHDLDMSIRASKYPMSTDVDMCNSNITDTVKALALSAPGSGHDQFLTGILVSFDLTFSNKAWVEAERYKFFNFVSSQSTMHRIMQFDFRSQCNDYVRDEQIEWMESRVKLYESLPDKTTKGAKELQLEILYNIPSGFELTARITTNYRQLKTIYHQRKTHRLPEWREFCEWIETLPYADVLIKGSR